MVDVEEMENTQQGEEPVEPEVKGKTKKRGKKVRRRKSKKSLEEEKEPDEEDMARLKAFQEGPRLMRRKSSSLSLEVEKMSQGKQLTHFQVCNY